MEKYEEWKFLVENQTRMKVNNLMKEGGFEFFGETLIGLYRKNDIIRHNIVPMIA